MKTRALAGVTAPPAESVGNAEKSFGEWIHCVVKSCSQRLCEAISDQTGKGPGMIREEAVRRIEKVYRSGWGVQKVASPSLSELTVGTGGALVPPEYAYGLMQDVAEDSIWWPRAFVQPMTSRTLLMPLPDPTVSLGQKFNSNLFAGMVMKFNQSQAPGISETEPQFRTVELTANELDGYLLATNQIVQDYPGLDAFIRQFTTRAVANWTDQEFFNGNAPSAGPQGIIQTAGTVTITRATANQVS